MKYLFRFYVIILIANFLWSCPVGTVITSKAKITYVMDGISTIDYSNKVTLVKTKHQDAYQLEFFKYDYYGDTYLNISHTTYSVSASLHGKFNTMTPLHLSSGEVVNPTQKVPLLSSALFDKTDPIIIVLKDKRANQSALKKDRVKITIDNGKGDHEVLMLLESDKNSSEFIGYIKPTTDKSKSHKADGYIYVYDGAIITAKPLITLHNNRSLISKYGRSLTIIPEIKTLATLEKEEFKKLWITHSSAHADISLGSHIRFDVEVGKVDKNIDQIFDVLVKLPANLKYVDNTFESKVHGIVFDKKLLDQNILLLHVRGISDEVLKFSYIATKSLGKKRTSTITAWCLQKDALISNIAKQVIKEKREFLQDKGFLTGKIKAPLHTKLKGIRVYLDNGMYTTTDKKGKFHFAGLSKNLYIAQLDELSVPQNYAPTECKNDTTKSKNAISQFIDLRYGGIKQVTFCIQKTKKKRANKRHDVFVPKAKKSPKMPTFSSTDLKKYKKEQWLWPPKDFNPAIGSIKVAILHKRSHKLKLFINGSEVSLLNYDTTVSSSKSKNEIALYRGVDLKPGDNFFEARLYTKEGKLFKSLSSKVHYSTTPVKAKILENQSYLIADGKNPIVIAVKLYDYNGYSVSDDIQGNLRLESPYQMQNSLDSMDKNPLSQKKEDTYSVYGDGIAYIRVAPTTKAGELRLHFNFHNKDVMLRTWIKPQPRDWIVVGFIEGTMGYKKIKEDMETTKDKGLYKKGKISLFAKGRIKGDTLLTIAYNNTKSKDISLFEKVNPDDYYTIYQDDSHQNYEAQSQRKLYLKIEKNQFYALFGDMDTGLEVTKLSKYRRVVNGMKSEYNGEKYAYKIFASNNKNIFVKDEIRADGTSGLYHVKQKSMVPYTEKVTIEVRDRYRPQILISSKVMQRFYDYSIDYDSGALYFKAPLLSTDQAGNPRYIVVDYEKQSSDNKHLLYGGRVVAKFKQGKVNTGATYIHENLGENKKMLRGIDVELRATKELQVNAEYAQTDHIIDEKSVNGHAYLLETIYQNKMIRLSGYLRSQSNAFGMEQENKVFRHSRKIGIDGRLDYFKNIAILLSAYSDKNLIHKTYQDVAEVSAEYTKEGLTSKLGYRYSKKNDAKNSQILLSTQKKILHNKASVRISHEQSLQKATVTFPTRSQLEARYAINNHIDLFLMGEMSRFDDQKVFVNSFGVQSRLWKGAQLSSSLEHAYKNDTQNLFTKLGIRQTYQLSKKISLSGSIDQRHTITKESVEADQEDFIAYSGAVNFNNRPWNSTLQIEYRDGSKQDKLNINTNLYNQVSVDMGVACGIRYGVIRDEKESTNKTSANFSLAYRPEKKWIILNRMDFIHDEKSIEKRDKFINNILISYKILDDLELSLQYGLKYIREKLDHKNFDTVIEMLGVHAVYQVGLNYDLQMYTNILHNYETKQISYAYGGAVGYKLLKDSWVGVGYNMKGFDDSDFSRRNYTNEGPYLQIRVKFNQHNFKDILENF